MTDLIDKTLFGERLTKARRNKGLTQAELGKIIFPKLETRQALQSKIKRYEAGKQLPKTREEVMFLAKALDVTWEYLIFGPQQNKEAEKLDRLKSENEKLRRRNQVLEAELKGIKFGLNQSAYSINNGQDKK